MSRLPDIFGEGRAKGIALVAVLAVGQAAAAGVAAFATRDVFAAFAAGGAEPPIGSFGLILAAGALIAALRVAERSIGEGVGQAYAASLRKALFHHLTRMPAGEVSRRRSGALAIRFVGDLTAVRNWVSLGVARLISGAIVLPGAIAALVLLDPVLAAAAAVPLLLSLVTMAILAPGLAPLHRRLRSKRARLAADMTERVPVAPELRLLGRDGKEMGRLDQSAWSLRAAAVARARASATLRAVPEIGATAAAAALLGAAFMTGAAAAEAAGALAALSILALPLRDLAGIWDRRRAWEVARDKCLAVLDAPVLEQLPEPTGRDVDGPARVDFDHVAAGALRDICIAAGAGEKIVIIGPNGAGKSTLLSLVAGLEHAAEGRVAIDGVDIRRLSDRERRKTVAYVGARSPILQGSLRRALTLGIDPRPDDEAIKAAVRRYGLGDAMQRLGGLDGRLAEGGRNLSSGEVRRVHLVRAALAGPGVLLLDEPDDALDVEGRACVERLVKETSATTLIVSHDLSLARRADVLWYVEDGRLRAAGRPEVLIGGGGPVARFFRPRHVA